MNQHISPLTNAFMTTLSIWLSLGIFTHDGRVDKAVSTALKSPITTQGSPVGLTDFLSTDAHTHPDHNAAKSKLMSSFTYQSPSVPPRKEQHHRYILDKIESGGRHAFDNTSLPILDA